MEQAAPWPGTKTRNIPIKQAHMAWAIEQQEPAVIPELHQEAQLSSANRLPSGLRSGCAIPLSTANRRLGAIFLGSERPVSRSEEGLRFASFVADRVAQDG